MLTLNDFVSISFVDFSQFFLQWIWIFSLILACCFTPLYNIHTKSKNFSSILRTVESILPSLWIKRSSWDKKILTLGILYYQLLKSINQIKKRTRRNSECQKTSFVRFLYLGLDFCPGLRIPLVWERAVKSSIGQHLFSTDLLLVNTILKSNRYKILA